jgi:hypothetical protein
MLYKGLIPIDQNPCVRRKPKTGDIGDGGHAIWKLASWTLLNQADERCAG